MGYIPSATTTTLRAKFTPIGRQKLLASNTNLITTFSLGDSDANYLVPLPLTSGQVPNDSGDLGVFSSNSNSTAPNVILKSTLLVNNTGITKKNVEPQSSGITTEYISNGLNIISGTNITQNIVNRLSGGTESLLNLLSTFSLPLNQNDNYRFTGLTSNLGGFANTALSGLAQTSYLIIALDNSMYGELIDGKNVKIDITTTSSTYTLYSTYQNSGLSNQVQDANYSDLAANTSSFGPNISFLFSDDILTPNGGNGSLSWSTGFNTFKPFSVNNKQYYNLTTNSNLGQTADTTVGIVYLDKGFVVITHPTIVNAFDVTTGATIVTCNSVSSSISQNITCISNRGEFAVSTNRTFTIGDTPRISEVGLYDSDGDLIALAKTDRHLVRGSNEFFALNIKISL